MFEPSKEPVNEAVISPAETENGINIFKQPNNPTPEQLQPTARKPPQAVPFTMECLFGSDKDDSNASLIPRKRRRRDPRLGVLITELVQQPTSNIEPAQVNQDDQSPIVEPTQVNQDSSAPPPPEHDSASVKLAKLRAFQDSIPQSKGKGISIGSGQGGDEDSQQTISELKQEIVTFKQEDLLIGNLDVRVSELAKENSQKSSDDEKASETSERVVVSPSQDSNLDQFLSSGFVTTEERREK
ncbi:unnamed protein product [Lactuca virosa]|uniref:Uncharacterized protein n=1 Tax=Lactuca virosa TaxID=75947 RepID=A0AAU9PJZ8_9ASTR|nr:unnamed protein product [Lactuca virosa]